MLRHGCTFNDPQDCGNVHIFNKKSCIYPCLTFHPHFFSHIFYLNVQNSIQSFHSPLQIQNPPPSIKPHSPTRLPYPSFCHIDTDFSHCTVYILLPSHIHFFISSEYLIIPLIFQLFFITYLHYLSLIFIPSFYFCSHPNPTLTLSLPYPLFHFPFILFSSSTH